MWSSTSAFSLIGYITKTGRVDIDNDLALIDTGPNGLSEIDRSYDGTRFEDKSPSVPERPEVAMRVARPMPADDLIDA
jgi:hypothetical protein